MGGGNAGLGDGGTSRECEIMMILDNINHVGIKVISELYGTQPWVVMRWMFEGKIQRYKTINTHAPGVIGHDHWFVMEEVVEDLARCNIHPIESRVVNE